MPVSVLPAVITSYSIHYTKLYEMRDMLKKLFGLGAKSAAGKDTVAARLGIDPEMRYCPTCGDEYRADSYNFV